MEIVQDTPKFDPNKKYRWTPDTEFVLTGGEFADLLNSLRAQLSTEEAQVVLLAQRASQALEAQLKNAVETGKAVEVSPEELPKGMQVVK